MSPESIYLYTYQVKVHTTPVSSWVVLFLRVASTLYTVQQMDGRFGKLVYHHVVSSFISPGFAARTKAFTALSGFPP